MRQLVHQKGCRPLNDVSWIPTHLRGLVPKGRCRVLAAGETHAEARCYAVEALRSSGLAVVALEQTAQSLMASDLTLAAGLLIRLHRAAVV